MVGKNDSLLFRLNTSKFPPEHQKKNQMKNKLRKYNREKDEFFKNLFILAVIIATLIVIIL